MNTTETKQPSTTEKTDAKASKSTTSKGAAVATAAQEPKVPKHLAIGLSPELRVKLNAIAATQGVSTASIVRRAVLDQIAGTDASVTATTAKVDAVQVGLDCAIAKLKLLEKALDGALADCVRVGDRLARATGDRG